MRIYPFKKIFTNIFFFYFLLIAMLSALGFYSKGVINSYSAIYEHPLMVIRDSGNIFMNLSASSAGKDFNSWNSQNLDNIENISKRYLGPAEDVEELKRNYADYSLSLKAGKKNEFELERLRASLAKIRNFASNRAIDFFNQADDKLEKANIFFYVLVIFMGVMAGWSVYIFIKSIENSLISQDLDRKLNEFKAEYKQLVENINEVFFITDTEGSLIYISPVCERLAGYSPRDLMGRKFTEFIHPEDLSFVMKSFKEILDGKTSPSEYRVKKKDGSYLWVRSGARPFYEGGLVKGIMGVLSDVSELKEKEKKILESEEWYRSMFQNHGAVKWIVDPENGVIADANDSAFKFYGYKNLIGMKVSDINVLGKKVMQEVKKASDKQQNYFEFVHKLADGTLRNVNVYSSPVKKGGKTLLYSVIHDVTEQKKAQEKVKTLYDMIDSSINEVYVFRSDNLKFDYANEGARKNTGYSMEELREMTPLDLKPEYNLKNFTNLIEPLRKGEKDRIVFYSYHRRKDGSFYPVEVQLQFYNLDGQGFFFANIEDITERKKAEEDIKKLNSLYLTLSQANQTMVRVKSEEELFREIPKVITEYGNFHTVWIGINGGNGRIKTQFHYGKLADVSEKIIISSIPGTEGSDCPTGRCFALGEIIVENDWLSKASASLKDFSEKSGIKSVCVIPIKKNGAVYRSMTVYSEEKGYFTQERIALLKELSGDMEYAISKLDSEAALEKSEAKYRSIFENMSAASCIDEMVYDEDGKAVDYIILDINPAFEKIIGVNRQETAGQLASKVYGTGRAPFLDIYSRVSETGEPVQFEAYFAPAKKHLAINAGSPGKGKFTTVFNDITEKKKYEEELEKTRAAIEQSGDTIVITDIKGDIEYVNPAFEKITGYSRSEALGKNPRILKSGIHDIEFYEKLWETISSGMIWSGVITNRRKDGSLYHEEAVISPVYGKNGQIINFVAVKRDITEKLNMQKALVQSQKMEAVGMLAGGVAHDFNNILTAIMSYAEILSSSGDIPSQYREDVNEILSSAQKGVSLTKQLLAFSRKQISSPSVCDVRKVVSNMEKMLCRLIGENIKLEIKVQEGNYSVFIDASQLEQILMNLVVNARDAVNETGKIEIEIAELKNSEDLKKRDINLHNQRLVKISVKDNGAGLSEEAKKHLFEPFFTTKEKGKGTGLGLSTVWNLVKQNKGEIDVESRPGQGTVFSIYFTAAGEEKFADVSREDKTAPLSGMESILLVEDEDSLLRLGKRILSGLGYKVFTASNGQEALEKMKEIGRVDILITDLIMPGMSGKALSDKLLSKGKAGKTLFMSGYTDEIIGKHGVLEKGVAFIYKPFSVNAFLSKVRETLDSNK